MSQAPALRQPVEATIPKLSTQSPSNPEPNSPRQTLGQHAAGNVCRPRGRRVHGGWARGSRADTIRSSESAGLAERPGGNRRSSARWCLPLLLACTLLAAGCASQNVTIDMENPIAAGLVERGLDPRQVILPFGLTDEMRAWAEKEVPATLVSPQERLERLRERLLDSKNMRVEYQWGYTGTAIEVFEQRRANCLAFTNLFVGMARHLGLDVFYVSVENSETYQKQGDLVVVSDHVAVGFGPGLDRVIYDFAENPIDDYRHVRRISDLSAIARYHSNRGAEITASGDMRGALTWLRTALKIDTNLANAWVNQGVVLRRLNDWPAAEESYRKALEVDPRVYSAYHNLASLLRLQERDDEAEALTVALDRLPNRNPYTYLALGDISRDNGRLEEAERYYRKAVTLGYDRAECYAALGHVAFEQGDMRTARRVLRRAEKLDPEEPRTVSLRSRVRGEAEAVVATSSG